jgi:ParB family chromosome partitioning protein
LAAGGTLTRDLFSAADACFFEPPALLDRLVAETLEEAAEAVRAEGWAWVEAAERLDRSRYQAVPPTIRDYTEDEQAQVDRLIQEVDEIALSGSDDDEDTYLALQKQLDALEAACHSFPEKMRAIAGAVVHLAADGTIGIERGCLRQEDAEAKAPALPAHAVETKPKPDLSASLLEELTAHRTQALQAVLARTPSIALDALVHGLALSSFYGCPALSCLQIAATTRYPLMVSPALAETPAARALAELRDQWRQTLPEEADRLWPWLQQADQPVKLELLAYLVAETLNAVQSGGRDAAPGAQALHAALGLDMAEYWSATAAGYFGRVSKGKVIEALNEAQALVPDADRMTKAVLAELAEQRIAGTRWLPPVLRCPTEATDEAEALNEAA